MQKDELISIVLELQDALKLVINDDWLNVSGCGRIDSGVLSERVHFISKVVVVTSINKEWYIS